jgi:predicted secreted protein
MSGLLPMAWPSAILVFIIAWCIVWFTVLPWRVEIPDKTEPGFAESAPRHPHLWWKAGVTTAITVVIWIAILAAIRYDVFSFREP